MLFKRYLSSIYSCLNNMNVSDGNGKCISIEESFEIFLNYTCDIKNKNKNIYLIGNGASATMASHMAADAMKNGHLKAATFSDAALMTAISNDITYEMVFALPLERFANQGDLLITISSSGNSENIIQAIQKAKQLGMTIVTLSGMDEDNRSRVLGDLNFYVPAQTYGEVECSHQIILHFWLDKYFNKVGIVI